MTVSSIEPPDYLDECPWDLEEPPREDFDTQRRTPYSPENADFSNRAHQWAQRELYPKIFRVPFENLSFEDDTLLEHNDRGELLDGEMAIDRIVKVTAVSGRFHQPLVFTVQERSRKPKYQSFQDITFTVWNNRTNLPSELHKLTANIFLYNYFDEDFDKESLRHRRPPFFTDAIAIVIPTTLIGICNGELRFSFEHNPRSQQPFIGIKFLDLLDFGAVIYWQNAPKKSAKKVTQLSFDPHYLVSAARPAAPGLRV